MKHEVCQYGSDTKEILSEKEEDEKSGKKEINRNFLFADVSNKI